MNNATPDRPQRTTTASTRMPMSCASVSPSSASRDASMMMMLDRRRLLSVLAHEYGHLRGNHGKLSAWIYRTRLS